MEGIKIENFEIKVSEQPNTVRIEWLGRSETRSPGDLLNPYLDSLINKIKGKDLLIDYTKLEFMNSSTVPPIIKFIKSCSLGGINTTVNYKKDIEWQNASFKPLQTVCMTLKNVSVVGV